MRNREGLTLLELLLSIAAIALLAGLLLPGLCRRREESRRMRCRTNLREIAKGMRAYLMGGGGWYPCPLGRCAKGSGANTYNGAEWLATLYWTRVVPDPNVFLCPSSDDSNSGGNNLGSSQVGDVAGGVFGSQTVSYAGMWWKSVSTIAGGAIRAQDFLPDEPMACDDTQGTINHGEWVCSGGLVVLFFDGHVEFKTSAELDITSEHGSVGKKPGLLWRLKN